MEYLCHKRPRICSSCRNHFPALFSYVSYHLVCIYINTTGATSGAGTAYPSGAHEFTPGFSGVRVTRALVLCVCFVDCCLSLILFLLAILLSVLRRYVHSDYPLVSSRSSYCVICLFLHRVMSNILLLFCVVFFVLFFFFLCLVYTMLQFSLDCPFLIALYVFSLSRLIMKVQMWHLNQQIFILP